MTNEKRQTADAARLERVLDARRHRDEQLEALWGMTTEDRVEAMWRGELSYFQLCEWSTRAPQEVPRLATDLTPAGERGEFAWIVMQTPEWAERAAPKRRR
jgi:hypothetical protein